MKIEERIRQTDLVVDSATVSMAGLTTDEIELAKKLCTHFDLKLGTLLRRAAAIEMWVERIRLPIGCVKRRSI